ncbi:hypothetical protein [Bradyrhizobium sp. 27S5]|uniref:hypothetical protein n=1 Tax=Bradyrhizobium sp. 27S5 TaxID=3139728 RepID=UPI0030CDE2C7
MAKQEIRRLPPFRAPFYFAPEYLRTAIEWKANFVALLDEIFGEMALFGKTDDFFGDWTLRVRFERIQLAFCARTGVFMLDEYAIADDDLGNPPTRWVGPCHPPRWFQRELIEEPPPAALRDEVARVSRFSDCLIERMYHRYRSALRLGHASVEARREALGNDFRVLAFDQLRGLRTGALDDQNNYEMPGGREYIDLYDATGRDGKVFYSLCVVPTGAAPGASTKKRAKQPDRRFRYPPNQYDPIIVAIVAKVKNLSKKLATQAEAQRLCVAEFSRHGLPVPKKSALESRVKKFF